MNRLSATEPKRLRRVRNLQGKRVLVVEGEPCLLRMIEYVFANEGAQVYTAASAQQGLHELYSNRPDLVVLETTLPDLDGFQACSRMLESSNIPIVLLTCLGREDDIDQGLNCGAADYVVKPFSAKMLLARAHSALLQAALTSTPKKLTTYSDGYLTIDLHTPQVVVGGKPIRLTAPEHLLLAYLLRNTGKVVTFEQILHHAWGWENGDGAHYVHAYMSRLRRKLERDDSQPQYLLSQQGVGYRFQPQVAA